MEDPPRLDLTSTTEPRSDQPGDDDDESSSLRAAPAAEAHTPAETPPPRYSTLPDSLTTVQILSHLQLLAKDLILAVTHSDSPYISHFSKEIEAFVTLAMNGVKVEKEKKVELLGYAQQYEQVARNAGDELRQTKEALALANRTLEHLNDSASTRSSASLPPRTYSEAATQTTPLPRPTTNSVSMNTEPPQHSFALDTRRGSGAPPSPVNYNTSTPHE